MNTNNKHPHFSRTVLHNGEERVKRIFRDQLAELAGLVPLLALFWYWRPPPPFEKA